MYEAINELLGEDTDYVDHKDIIQVNNSNKNAYGNEHKENTNNNYLLDDNEREKVIIDGEEYEDYEDDGAFLDNIPITNNSQKNKTSKTSKVKKPMRLEDNKKEILDLTEVVENQQANDIIKDFLEKIPQEIDIKDEELDEILGINKKQKGNKDISMIEHSYKQFTPKSVTVESKKKKPKAESVKTEKQAKNIESNTDSKAQLEVNNVEIKADEVKIQPNPITNLHSIPDDKDLNKQRKKKLKEERKENRQKNKEYKELYSKENTAIHHVIAKANEIVRFGVSVKPVD